MGGAGRAVRGHGWALAAAVLLFVLGGLVCCRFTVADPDFYTDGLRAADGYDRVYSQVLTDPAVRRELRSGRAGVPLRSDMVIDNLPLLVTPAALREAAAGAADSLVRYLAGERAGFAPEPVTRPLVRSAQDAGRRHLAALEADTDPATAKRLDVLMRRLETARWRSGTLPGELRGPLASFVDHTWDRATARQINALLRPALGSLDTGADAKQPSPRPRADASPAAVAPPAALRPAVAASRSVPLLGGLALCLAGACALALRSGSRRTTVSVVCGGAAGLGALVGLCAWLRLPDAAAVVPRGLPPSVHGLLADVVARLYERAALLWGLGVLALALAAVLPWAVRWTVRAWAVRATGPGRLRPRLGVVGAATAAQLMLLPAALSAPPPAAPARACNGSPELCGRRYDEVVQIGSHNAMSTVADGFVNAHQDPTLTGQLDLGVRALLLDTHYWESGQGLLPEALAPQLRRTLVDAVDDVVTARPGTWLCHGPCRLGATRLTPQLRALGEWLRAHPREVVTLVVQDGITTGDTRRAFAAAGLGRYLFRPAADPSAAWPTLGRMIASGRRLVVFSESRDGPMRWYRKFYDYGVETPYAVHDARSFSCRPGRGGDSRRKRLFLMNHFVTRDHHPDRAAAARVNRRAVIVRRARTCTRERGRAPTIIAVNHAALGDAVGAARVLNGVDGGGKR